MESKSITIELFVQGMDCPDEISIIRDALDKVQGFISMEANLMQSKLTVSFDPEETSEKTIINRINQTVVKVVTTSKESSQKTGWVKLNSHLITAVLCGLFTFIAWIVVGEKYSESLWRYLYIVAVIIGIPPFAIKAYRAFGRLRFDMNVLMTVAVIGALIIGEWLEAAVVTFLFSLAELLESYSISRARRAIQSLLRLTPREVLVKRNQNEVLIPVEEAKVNDIMILRPGDKIALDGEVVSGNSSCNEAPITGESRLVEKKLGDKIYAGTINQDGALEVRVTKLVQDTTLAHIIHLVEQAQSQRAPAQAFVDKFAQIYTPLMLASAVLIWIALPLVFGVSWHDSFYRALAILVIGCPCALVISTPVAVVSGLTIAARHGILIKGGIFLEEAAKLQAIAFDKTGTLTKGIPRVQNFIPFSKSGPEELLKIAAAVELRSEHPLGQAIVQYAKEKNTQFLSIEDFLATRGKGAQARLDGHIYYVGSHRFIEEKLLCNDPFHERINEYERHGYALVVVANENEILGVITLSDSVRPETKTTIGKLKDIGIKKIMMLSGDHIETAKIVAQESGIDTFYAELLPEDKVTKIHKLKNDYTHVAMVGDGINDAPALASASIGIAMGVMGNDAAIETADVALATDDLTKITTFIQIGRFTRNIIIQNICFSIGIKVLFFALAITGLSTLWMAVVADMGVSLLVIFNSLRILRIK